MFTFFDYLDRSIESSKTQIFSILLGKKSIIIDIVLQYLTKKLILLTLVHPYNFTSFKCPYR